MLAPFLQFNICLLVNRVCVDLRPFKLFLRRYGGSGALCNDFLKMLLCGGDLRRFTPKKDRLAAMSECISTDTFSAASLSRRTYLVCIGRRLHESARLLANFLENLVTTLRGVRAPSIYRGPRYSEEPKLRPILIITPRKRSRGVPTHISRIRKELVDSQHLE